MVNPTRRLVTGLLLAITIGIVHGSLALADGPPAAEPKRPWLPDVEVETYTLANGLSVVLHQDRKTPLVAVHLTYIVGSKDDPPGRTGLAHLYEHLMFEGSSHSDSSFSWPIYRYMTDARGSTGCDRTEYHETVTSNALERVLWLEADRMAFLVPSVTQAKLDNARKVVINERWETLDELPYGEVTEAWSRALYPPGHPYRHAIIGSIEDLFSARLVDVNEFQQRHYAPNNAVLCLAGDFQVGQAKRWIRKYFGPLAPGPRSAPAQPNVPTLDGPLHITLFDRVSHAYAGLIWPTVPANHPDEAALDVLAAILGGESRWNRLSRALTYDRQFATQTSASHPTALLAGTFQVHLFARSGRTLDELVRLADAEIERLKHDGPTADEVKRVKIERRRLQSVELDSVTSKARVLSENMATYGDPLAYRSVLARVFTVTPDQVRRVAQDYLGSRRIEVDVYPGSRTARREESQPLPQESIDLDLVSIMPRADTFDRSTAPEAGVPPVFVPPAIKRIRLPNGLDIRIVERHDLPIVKLRLVVRSGETSVPRGKEGLSVMTVNLLEEGTRCRTALQLEGDLIEIGASLSTDGQMESSTVSLTTPTRNLDRALDLFADVILKPALADDEYLRLKLRRVTDLEDRADNAEQIAQDVLPRLIYHAGHPYARPRLGTLESVLSITREDIVEFYARYFVPGNASLVVIGDVRPDAIAAALKSHFGAWPAAPVPRGPMLPPTPSPGFAPHIYLIDRPGAAQSVIAIGRVWRVREFDRAPNADSLARQAGRPDQLEPPRRQSEYVRFLGDDRLSHWAWPVRDHRLRADARDHGGAGRGLQGDARPGAHKVCHRRGNHRDPGGNASGNDRPLRNDQRCR